jgi:multicomponent Na+:H+ antiporter subunit C
MILDGYNYWVSILLMMIGFFGVASSGNLVKKLMCLGIFQVSVLLFYVSVGYVKNASVPIVVKEATIFVNPIPHVLMLTAIVVGVAVMAVGLSIAVRIKEEYGTIEEDEIFNLDWKMHEQEIEK